MDFFATPSKNHVLLSHLYQFSGIADAMRTRRTGRTDGV